MFSASLKHNIVVERRTKTRSSQGAVIETWAEIGKRKAQMIYNSGGKVYDSDQEVEINQYQVVFIFRYLESFDYDCRILFNGQEYVIETIQELFRRDGYRVTTERRENG